MLNLTELFVTLCSWLIWLTPFTFVFFLAHTVREVVREGEKDVPGNSAVTPRKKAAPFGTALSVKWITFSGAAPGGRPRSGRG